MQHLRMRWSSPAQLGRRCEAHLLARMRLFLGVCSAALLAPVAPLEAQQSQPVLKVDIDVGLGWTGGGGMREDRQAVAFGAIAAFPLRLQPNSRLVAAVGVHQHLPFDLGTRCTVVLPSTSCIPPYPQFISFSVLAGREFGNARSAGGTRFLAGPAVIRTNEKAPLFNAPGRPEPTLFGFLGRADVSVLQRGPLGIKVWTQLSTAQPFQSERYVMWSFGTGVRLQ